MHCISSVLIQPNVLNDLFTPFLKQALSPNNMHHTTLNDVHISGNFFLRPTTRYEIFAS